MKSQPGLSRSKSRRGKELCDGHAHGVRHSQDGHDAWILRTPLDAAQVGPVRARPVRELFLRDASFKPGGPNGGAQ